MKELAMIILGGVGGKLANYYTKQTRDSLYIHTYIHVNITSLKNEFITEKWILADKKKYALINSFYFYLFLCIMLKWHIF